MTRRTAIAILLAAVALAFHVGLARRLDALGVFRHRDVLFDSDINSRLLSIAGWKHLGIKHPNLMPYFTPPVALVAKVIRSVRPGSGTPWEVQRALGTWVVPLATALKTVLVFMLFGLLGFSIPSTLVATLLEMVSFTTLIFGSIPESYGLTAFALAIGFVSAAASGREITWRSAAGWLALGVFATGITLTNVVLVTLLFAAVLWKADPRLVPTAVRAAVFAAVVFAMTGISAYVLDAVLVPPKSTSWEVATDLPITERIMGQVRGEISAFVAKDPARRLVRYPTAVANAFAPPAPQVQQIPTQPTVVSLTMEYSPNVFGFGDPFGAALFFLVVIGAACLLSLPSLRPIAVACLAICAFSWLLSLWGMETVLYSQHWQIAAVILLAGVMRVGAHAKLITALVAALTLVVGMHNILVVRDILTLVAVQLR